MFSYSKKAREAINNLSHLIQSSSIEDFMKFFDLKIIETNKIDGLGEIIDNRIYVKKGLDADLQTFIVTHELGHRVLHFDEDTCYNFSYSTKITKEKEANDFALLLLSLHYMCHADDIKIKLNELYNLKL